eukprot:TRINITY_DN18928_c0_g1_i4.p1 TRINITY_DN18928_c0_g1~~TRINITY_DN18928_c0_g1_i4.p1  ORF type:complete len:514 (+),score=102.58 TRINITY_DN18928_c0_g1_i4:271-1812(+)
MHTRPVQQRQLFDADAPQTLSSCPDYKGTPDSCPRGDKCQFTHDIRDAQRFGEGVKRTLSDEEQAELSFSVALQDVGKLKGKQAEHLISLEKQFGVKIHLPDQQAVLGAAQGEGAPGSEPKGKVRISGEHQKVEAALSEWRFKAPRVKIYDITLREGDMAPDQMPKQLPALAGRAKVIRDNTSRDSPFKALAEWVGHKANSTVGVSNQLLGASLQCFVSGGTQSLKRSSSAQDLNSALSTLTDLKNKSRWGQLFNRVDSNHDGVLTEPEMATLISELLQLRDKKPPDPLEVNRYAKEAILRMDKSQGQAGQGCKNAVSLREFEQYVQKVEPELFAELGGWNDVFARYADGDTHKISMEGMKRLVKDLWALHPSKASEDDAVLEHEASLAISQMDLDGDGLVGFPELLKQPSPSPLASSSASAAASSLNLTLTLTLTRALALALTQTWSATPWHGLMASSNRWLHVSISGGLDSSTRPSSKVSRRIVSALPMTPCSTASAPRCSPGSTRIKTTF